MKTFLKVMLLLCMVLLVVALATAAFAAEAADAVVYVDQAGGNDASDGLTEATAVKDIKVAYTVLENAMDAKGLITSATATGKIVFVTDYRFDTFTSSSVSKDFGSGAHTYRVILEGKTPTVSLQFKIIKQSYLGMMGPTTIQNLNVRLSDDSENTYFSIHGRGGSDLIIGQGVTTSDNADRRPMLSAGPYFNVSKNCYMEINSGDWRTVYAGCYTKKITGSSQLVMNGGYAASVCAVYNSTVTGDVDITVNGGTVGSLRPVAGTGSVGGAVNVTLNGGTITGTVNTTGTMGSCAVNVTGDDMRFTYNGQLTLTGITASKLFLGSNTRVIFAETVTGSVAVTIDKAVRYNVHYITAPADTGDNAFTFEKTMTPTVSDDTKSWINTDESEFTGLVLKAPKEFTVKLYTGTKDGSQVTPDKTETIDGIKYQYFANAMGNYRYVTSRSGYYTLTKALWMSEEKSLAKTVVDASSGKRDSIGWEPTSVKDYSDEAHKNIVPEDKSTLWWNDYSPLLVSPYFTDDTRAEHRATTQEEMESFIASLDDKNDNMYIYSLGTSPVYNFDIPIVIFTKVDLSGAKTLEEAAALIRADNKLVIHYQAQIHGNEPAGGEAALNMIARLDGQWGNGLLDTVNCYVIPRANPDGSKNYTRSNAQGVNLNRDMLLATMPETAALRYACDLFEPDINIDGHEFTYQPELATGSYSDLMCSSGANGNFSQEFIQLSETMARNHFQTFFDYGLQPSYYTNKANSYSPATNSGYHSTRGTFHFLMESRGIGGGNYTMTRRVVCHLIMAESIFEYAVANHETITSIVDAERLRSVKLGETYEEDDLINLYFKESLLEEYAHKANKWDLVSGTLTSVNDTIPIFYREANEGKTRVRPTAYVFPDGEVWTQDVLDVLEANGIRYYRFDGSKMLKLRQLTGEISNGSLGAETYYGFENGCYVVPLNQDRSILISYVFEPDICGYSAEDGYGSLTQMGVIPAVDGGFPVYHYVHDLEADGTIATYVGADAPTGLTGVNPTYIGGFGKITGLDPAKAYAYRNSMSVEYTVVSGVTAIENLTIGTWYVRYAGDDSVAYMDAVVELSYGNITEIVVYVDQTNGVDTNTGFVERQSVVTLEAAISVLKSVVDEGMTGKVVFLSDYDLGTSAYNFPSHSFTVTYTGKTPEIALIKTGGSDQNTAAVRLSGPSVFEYITIKNSTTATYNNFNCNGHKTVMGLGITCTPNSKGKNFMLAAGGSSSCSSTDLTVLSGDWNMIYAGGYSGSVTGDAKLTVRNATVAGQIMAGYTGSVGGNITYDIADVTTNGVYLGLAKTNSVGGNITATIGPNSNINYLYAGNRDSGNVKGTVHVIVDRTDLSGVTLYGTSKTSGTVGKSVLTNRGGILGTVSGFGETIQQACTGIYNICQGGAVAQTCYTFAEAAEVAGKLGNAVIQLGSDAQDDATVTGDFVIDLNGYDLSGITVNGTVYGLDSTTDGYTCDKLGTLTLASGTVASHWKSTAEQVGGIRRYMAIEDGNGNYTFHRFYIGVTHQTLRPAVDGVGYKAVFYGDDMVLAKLQGFGFNMQLGENSPKLVTGGNIVSGKVITLRIDNYDVVNHGETELYASAALVLKDGTVIESTRCVMTLRNMLETLNNNYSAMSAEQRTAVADFIKKYTIITTWKVENLI